MNTLVTSLPPSPAGAGLRRWLNRAGNGIWKALTISARARLQPRLIDLADQCEALQPELAKELRAASRHGPMA